jgi:hypothetical protein
MNPLERQESAFDFAKSQFQSAPIPSNFNKLWETKPSSEVAYVTEIVYGVAARESFAPLILPSLVESLIREGRFQEATYFCDLWLEKNRADPNALRLACILACRRIDNRGAHEHFQSLANSGASDGVIRMLETIIMLAFTDGKNAVEPALHMLSAVPRDQMAPYIALDVAFRTRNARVFVSALGADPSLGTDSKVLRKFLPIFKVQLINMLRSRRAGLRDD